MRVLVIGSNGFIGKNLTLRLNEATGVEVIPFTREHNLGNLVDQMKGVDLIFHLAGVNRPENPGEFFKGNSDFTHSLCNVIRESDVKIPLVFASSIQATKENPYGQSKRAAEEALLKLKQDTGNPVHIFRLQNVFGKWSRPNYNSVVATFCHNIVHDLPIQIHDPDVALRLVYIDDVVEAFMRFLKSSETLPEFIEVVPEYQISVGELANQLRRFKNDRDNMFIDTVGVGLTRALHATYLSHLPVNQFAYPLKQHGDHRGVFVEMLKTEAAGQFSFFTAHCGVTRGGHYHHTKTEKFLVLQGKALFRFRHVLTGEVRELTTTDENPEVVETVPGWVHDVTNVGADKLICMLWANEVFNPEKPDTFGHAI